MRSNKGFTIVEVLVAVIVLSIFITVVTVGVAAIRNKDASKGDTNTASNGIEVGREYYEFAVLGVKIEKTDSNRSLYFKQSPDRASYGVYDKKVDDIIKDCYGEHRDIAIGTISRSEGFLSGSDKTGTKQFEDFGISFIPAGNLDACANPEFNDRLLSSVDSVKKQISYVITGAEKL